jgi:ADP-ribosylation factor GTPase-activating protein 2/3
MSSVAIFAAVQPSPRTVTSASLKSTSSSPAGAKPITDAALWSGGKATVRVGTSSSAGGGTRSSKLGAKKAAASINYEEAERKARAEEDQAKQLNHHTERDSEAPNHPAASLSVHLVTSRAPDAVAATSPVHVGSVADPQSTIGKYGASQDSGRLGIGFKRLGLPANVTSDASSYRTAKLGDAPTTARERFGNQKAISSEMFFERGAYDPATVSEAKAKLAQFEGATSISSNQYFGQEEGEEGLGLSGSFTGNESLSALEASTRDALNRVMTKEEVQNALESVRAGALKVSNDYYSLHFTSSVTSLQLSSYLANLQ